MSATNPNGSQKYWVDGKPSEILVSHTKPTTNGQKFWDNGLPSSIIVPRKRPKTMAGN